MKALQSFTVSDGTSYSEKPTWVRVAGRLVVPAAIVSLVILLIWLESPKVLLRPYDIDALQRNDTPVSALVPIQNGPGLVVFNPTVPEELQGFGQGVGGWLNLEAAGRLLQWR